MNITPLLEALSLLIIHSPIEQKELIKKLRYVLVHTAKQEYPKSSIANLSEKIGILRGTISNYLTEEPPKVTTSNETHILNSLWKIKDKNNLVNIKGPNSFYSIARKQLCGKHSPETSLNSLIKSSSVEFKGDKLLIISHVLIVDADVSESIRIMSELFLRLVKTIFWNINHNNKKYQRSIVSKSIHPNLINKTHNEVFNYIKNISMVEIRKIIESYEDENICNFPEYVVSIFESFDN